MRSLVSLVPSLLLGAADVFGGGGSYQKYTLRVEHLCVPRLGPTQL